MKRDRLAVVGAGLAFYWMLALVPGLIALVSVYGLFSHPDRVADQVRTYADVLPAPAQEILVEQLSEIAGTSSSALGAGVVLGFVAALWSASTGMKALVSAIGIAFGVEEDRGFLRDRGIAILSTFVFILMVALAVTIVGALPAIAGAIGLEGTGRTIVEWLRWPLLLALGTAVLAVAYRAAPNRHPKPAWRWAWAGAAFGALVWLAGSALFGVYVRNFASYNETYGSLGGTVVLLLWLFVTALSVLLGAELAAVLERRREGRGGRAFTGAEGEAAPPLPAE